MPLRQNRQYQKVLEGIALHHEGQECMCPLYGHYVPPPPLIKDAPSCLRKTDVRSGLRENTFNVLEVFIKRKQEEAD